jgi:hypothetical protein
MASYGNHSQGASRSRPLPYYASPPPPKQPSIILRPSRRGRKIACGTLGCLLALLVVVGGGAGSCAFYTKWYLPRKARDYIDATVHDFKTVSGIVDKIGKRIPASFSETMHRRTPMEIERDILEIQDLADNLVKMTAASRKNMPEDSSIAEGLDRSLKEYYDLTGDLAKSVRDLAAFYRKQAAVLKEMDAADRDFKNLKIKTLGEVGEAEERFKKQAESFETQKQAFEAMKLKGEMEESRVQMLKLLEGLVVYMNDTARALKTLRTGARKWSTTLLKKSKADSKKAQEKFRKVLEEYEEKSKVVNGKIRKKYKARTGEIIDKQHLVENYYDSLREKYGLP